LNTADVNSNSLSISLVHYDGTSRETNGKTILYDPSQQPMLSGSAPATITLIPHTADVQNGQTFDVAANQALNGILARPGGVVNVQLGGSVTDTLVYGNLNILPGGFADPTTIYEGGSEVVSSGGTDLGAQVFGGEQDVFGYVSGVTIYAGIEIVESGGTSDNTVVSSGGTLELLGGAVASAFTIGSGGTLVIASGYLLSGYEVASGVTLEVAAGGTAIATIVDSGATLELFGGGVASGVSISTGAILAVASGYAISSYDVLSGITLEVAVGGTADLTTVESGGTLELLGGAVASNSNLSSGGTLKVASGLVGNGIVDVRAGGSANVGFLATGSGGLDIADTHVTSNAFSGTVSGFGGINHANHAQFIDLVSVTSAARTISFSYAPAIGSGTLTVSSGGAVVASIEFIGSYSSANFHVTAGSGNTVKITDPEVANGGSVQSSAAATFPRLGIDLPDIAFGAQTTLAYMENAAGTGGALTVTDDRHAATIALLGNYMAGSFVAAADGHGGTLVTRAQQTEQPLLTHPRT
jgi:autotransporter passenger strand-loop-strand repeat protein